MALSLFRLNETLTSGKNSVHFYQRFRRKTPEKWKTRQRVFHMTLLSWVNYLKSKKNNAKTGTGSIL